MVIAGHCSDAGGVVNAFCVQLEFGAEVDARAGQRELRKTPVVASTLWHFLLQPSARLARQVNGGLKPPARPPAPLPLSL